MGMGREHVGEGGMGRSIANRPIDPHERWIDMSVLEKDSVSQDRERAQLEAQISALEADVAQWDDFLPQIAKPLLPKRLLLQPDNMMTSIPKPFNVASSVPAPPPLLGLPQSRDNGPTGSHRASKGPPCPEWSTCPNSVYHHYSHNPAMHRFFNYLPGPSNPPGPSIPPTQKDRDVLTKLPKSLLYDGQSNWFVFQSKFERYARVQDWSDAECADCLGWCLTGKAVNFYALLSEGRGTVPYAELMQRLQERFGARELTATAQGRFHVSHQD
ncbi:hypothetical protein DPMN_114150 [Dreissena polymorpha]|uniref:Uncharacterized protein n=1 Tax=Dreissena polymorpha TaxID=45954 RepID=A0A9D4KIL9_DREPO|nr:hypothetical protein DPMN_114150 [Dreissena polymorpha]